MHRADEEDGLKNMTVSQIVAVLQSYIGLDSALQMAEAIHEDMNSARFLIEQAHYTSPNVWRQLGVVPQAEYKLPPNQFDIDSAIGSEGLEGSFLTTGNLLRLGQCVLLGRRYLTGLWPGTFATQIRGPGHLDTLKEIWWLKFWRGIQSVVRSPKVSANDPDFEWQIGLCDGLARCTINLEVKRRTSNINQLFKEGRPTASVRKIAKKFGPVGDGTANIAALTLYYPVSDQIDRNLRAWMEAQEHLHGLLVWTEGHASTTPLKKFIKASHRWVEYLITGPEPEDLKIAGRVKGTLCKAEDAPQFIARLANEARWGGAKRAVRS